MVREDYKHTEIGLIPLGWDTAPLEDWCEPAGLVRGPFGGALKKEYFKKRGNAVYEQRHAIHGAKTPFRYFIDEEKYRELIRFAVSPNDLIVSCSGTIGRIEKVPEGSRKGVINQALLKITLKSKHDRSFFVSVFRSDVFQSMITENSHGGAMPNLVGMDTFRQILIQLPPPEEQRAIAEALSDVDALIESLEKLITKKLAIKTATMQALLTGKTRLPEFDESWEEKTFDEIFQFGSTATNSRADLTKRGDTLYFHYGDLHTKFKNWFDVRSAAIPKVSRHLCSNATRVNNGDWVMADASEDIEGIGSAIEVRGLRNGQDAVAGLHTFLLREKNNTFADGFKAYLGNSEQLKKQYRRVMTGMKVFGVSKAALKDLVLPVPPRNEQAAIVTVLSDMDDNITALTERLKQSKNVKQGMMQELLTGRTRLV